jgi:general secretion pathway protein I
MADRTPKGFTLIEMMVAIAVFSLAALALIRLEGATIRNTAILNETMIAQLVARNVAVETLTDPQPPATGLTQGQEDNGGRAWQWTRMATTLGDQGALQIVIDVRDQAGTSLGHLTVIRPPLRKAVP